MEQQAPFFPLACCVSVTPHGAPRRINWTEEIVALITNRIFWVSGQNQTMKPDWSLKVTLGFCVCAGVELGESGGGTGAGLFIEVTRLEYFIILRFLPTVTDSHVYIFAGGF